MKNEQSTGRYERPICDPAHAIFTNPEVYAAYEDFRKRYVGHEITGHDRPDISRERDGRIVTFKGDQPSFSGITTDSRFMVHVRTAPMVSMRPQTLAQRYFAVIGDMQTGEHIEYRVIDESYTRRFGAITWNRTLFRDPTAAAIDIDEPAQLPQLCYANQRLQLHQPNEPSGAGFYHFSQVWNDLEWLAMQRAQELFELEAEERIA